MGHEFARKKKDRRPGDALRCAEELRDAGATWVDAHNKLFGAGGEISKLFKTEAERAAFLKTEESEKVGEILESLPRQGKPATEPNGRILLRVPRTVHSALLAEAEREGISLNQLLLAKVCIGLEAAGASR